MLSSHLECEARYVGTVRPLPSRDSGARGAEAGLNKMLGCLLKILVAEAYERQILGAQLRRDVAEYCVDCDKSTCARLCEHHTKQWILFSSYSTSNGETLQAWCPQDEWWKVNLTM